MYRYLILNPGSSTWFTYIPGNTCQCGREPSSWVLWHQLRSRTVWVCIPTLPLASWVTLDKSIDFLTHLTVKIG